MEFVIKNRKNDTFIIHYDEIDQNIIDAYRWYVGNDGYVRTVEKYPKLLHRLIMGLSDRNIHVDHKNRDKLDNTRDNLRLCNHAQNMANRNPGGESKYLGVSHQRYKVKDRQYHYIIASINIGGKKKMLGRFKTEEAAAMAYDKVAFEHRGEFANLNFPNLVVK